MECWRCTERERERVINGVGTTISIKRKSQTRKSSHRLNLKRQIIAGFCLLLARLLPAAAVVVVDVCCVYRRFVYVHIINALLNLNAS